MFNSIRSVARLVALAILTPLFNPAQAQQTPAPPAPVLLANLQDEQIEEGSGLAASRRYPGLLYVHNDSGDSARVFLVNSKGETVATIKLKGASARDWEDITFAGEYLYVGDIGDNFGWRDALQVYRFKEPELDPTKLGQEIEVTPALVALRLPGTSRNSETLLAAPDDRIWIVTKDPSGSSVFEAQFKEGQVQNLKRLGEKIEFGAKAPLTRLATGGDFSPDGTRLCVVTYTQLYEWKLPAPFDVANLSKITPQIRSLPNLRQWESVCYSADGTQIFVSSEGKKAPVYVFKSSN